MRSEGGRQYCMCVWGKLSTGAKNTVCGGGGTTVLYTRKDGVTYVCGYGLQSAHGVSVIAGMIFDHTQQLEPV